MIENKYSVYVRCITYNQANYIKDALEGFCMQQTTFPFVCAIFDDASTDGEIEILKTYLNDNFELDDSKIAFTKETDDYVLQYARHKDNHNCFFVVVFLKYNHWRLKKAKDIYVQEWIDLSEYKAECEGDDYWIDPLKLQKQVDFLDQHEDYSMCCGGYQRFFEGALEKEIVFNKSNSSGFSFTLEDNLESWYTKTLTSMVRIKDIDDYHKSLSKHKYSRDTSFFYYVLAKGKGYYFSNIMGVYNVHPEGVFSMADNKKNALIAANSYRELYEFNNHDMRLEKVLFNWICIVIVECYLPIKDILKEACYAQKLVQSVGMELKLFKSTGIGIYRRMCYGAK